MLNEVKNGPDVVSPRLLNRLLLRTPLGSSQPLSVSTCEFPLRETASQISPNAQDPPFPEGLLALQTTTVSPTPLNNLNSQVPWAPAFLWVRGQSPSCAYHPAQSRGLTPGQPAPCDPRLSPSAHSSPRSRRSRQWPEFAVLLQPLPGSNPFCTQGPE